MIDVLLGLFTAVMLFASLRHVRALLHRRQVLREMYRALDEAADRGAASLVAKPEAGGSLSGEHSIVRGVLVETPPELRREKRTTGESGRVAI